MSQTVVILDQNYIILKVKINRMLVKLLTLIKIYSISSQFNRIVLIIWLNCKRRMKINQERNQQIICIFKIQKKLTLQIRHRFLICMHLHMKIAIRN